MTEEASWRPWRPLVPDLDMAAWQPVMRTLITGELAFSDSEEWRHECEARDIAAMPQAERNLHLTNVEAARGKEAVAKLRKTIDEVIAVMALGACP